MNVALTRLGSSKLNNGVAQWQGTRSLTNDTDDVEPFGEGDVFQALGLTSQPAPADEKGQAESIVIEGVDGLDAVHVGARDTRNAAIVGSLGPGDTCLHSTGPEQAAQCRLSEKRQASLVTKSSDGKTMILSLDGVNDQLVINAMGCTIVFQRGFVELTNGEAGIAIDGGNVHIKGNLKLAGIPTGHVLAAVLPTGTLNTATAPIPIIGAQGTGGNV